MVEIDYAAGLLVLNYSFIVEVILFNLYKST